MTFRTTLRMSRLLALATALTLVRANSNHELTQLQIFPETTYPGAVNSAIKDGARFGQTSDPFYPSPWMTPGAEGWEEAYVKAKDFVSQLTLMEKVNLTTGVGYVIYSSSLFDFADIVTFPLCLCSLTEQTMYHM